MLKLNRDSVLKSFLEKVREAKRMNMRDVKMTIKEVDDLAQVINEMLSENVSKLLEKIFETPSIEETPKLKSPKKRKIIQTIEIEKEPLNVIEEEKPKIEQVQNSVSNEKPQEQLFKNKPVVMPKIEPEPEPIEEDEEDDDNTLYGGTW